MVTACSGVLFPAQPAGPPPHHPSRCHLSLPFPLCPHSPPSPLFIDRAIQRAASASSRMKVAKGKGATKKETKPALKPVDDRGVGKRKAAAKPVKSKVKKPKKEEKVKKDPNKPKRPASAFFVFLEEFRKTYKQEHPNVKAVSAVGKAGGEKWKSLSKAEKAPYEAKAAKRKVEYEKQMSAYNKKQESGAEAEADEEEEEGSEQSGEEEGEEEEDEEEEEDDE